MKKIIFFLFSLFCMVNMYAAGETATNFVEGVSAMHDDVVSATTTLHEDVTGVVTTLYGDTKAITQELYPEVKAAIASIAKAIGIAAEHVYSVLVKKYLVEGLIYLIPFILGIVLLIVGWIKLEKYVKTHEAIKWQILYPICILIAGIVSLCSVDYHTMFMGIINPEFGAINYILDFTKEMIK